MIATLFSFLAIISINNKNDSISNSYREKFIHKLDSLQETKNLEAGMLGVSIRNCKTNENLVDFNSKKALKPASTLKLVTTATALGILGPNYRYETNLEYNGTIKNDTLFGNIVIRASGDPSLGSWRYDETLDYSKLFLDWASKIQKLNIKVVKGTIIPNEGFFTDNSLPDTWQWGDMGNYFGAGSFGLNINENLFRAHFKTGKKSKENTNLFQIEPFLQQIEIINSVIADKETSSDDVQFYSAPKEELITAKGSLPLNQADFIVKGSIPDPPNLTVQLLKNSIAKLGISILNEEKYSDTLTRNIITTVKSPTLFELCLNTNFESINLYAESILKTIPTLTGKTANTKNGIDAIKKFWEDKSINTSGLYMKDGSGLSTTNAISAATMTDILAATSKEPFFGSFHQGIPVLGKDGTVKNIAKNRDYSNSFSVKTGTIEKVKAYAGYYYNKKGDLLSFSIMANQFESSENAMGRELVKLFEWMFELE